MICTNRQDGYTRRFHNNLRDKQQIVRYLIDLSIAINDVLALRYEVVGR
jgi:hypothetical protein